LGLRVRALVGSLEVGASAAYGVQKFFLRGDEALPLVPDVKYGYLRFGVDGRVEFGNLSVGAKLGMRRVSSFGELESLWFPGAKGAAFDMGLFGGYGLSEKLGIALGVDYVRYGFDFNAIPPTNPTVAGGAIDQYLIGWMGIRFVL
jgi:hypothetical protein